MFTSQEYIDRKTGSDGFGRLEYLQALVNEYQDTEKNDSKEQVLANLANFAYDPINYEHFKKLNVVDLFLDALTEENEKMVEFGIGGVCNCCLEITSETVAQTMTQFSTSSNKRLSNLANIFLKCSSRDCAIL